MKNASDKSCRDNQHTHFVFSNFFPENRAVYGTMWNNVAGPGRPQMTIWRMRIAYWIPKATDTHSEYVILIAFPRQQWSRERAPMLHFYTHLAVFKQSSRNMVSAGHPGVRVRVQCRQIQMPKVGADRNEEIIPANRLTQTTCNDYTHLH